MNLLQALHLPSDATVAIVGAGGKTTAAFSLARQVDGPAWVTTTTHLGTDQVGYADRHFVLGSAADFTPELYTSQKVTLLTGPFTTDDRLHSPSDELLEFIHLAALDLGIPLIIEADGSRSIPLKAPGEHEPVIPAWVTHVIVVVGMYALGRPLSPQNVFRAERFAELTGLHMGEALNMQSICAMLLHPLGGLKNIPAGAQKIVLFNQADDPASQLAAHSVVPQLLNGGFDRVIYGGLKSAPEKLDCYKRE